MTHLALSLALLISALLISVASEFATASSEQEQLVEPKLVCYYTNWAKDRPDPWSYVSIN